MLQKSKQNGQENVKMSKSNLSNATLDKQKNLGQCTLNSLFAGTTGVMLAGLALVPSGVSGPLTRTLPR